MALVLNDRVKETSTTTGTGTLNLSGAVSGFDTFVAGVADVNDISEKSVRAVVPLVVGVTFVNDPPPAV